MTKRVTIKIRINKKKDKTNQKLLNNLNMLTKYWDKVKTVKSQEKVI